MAADPAGAPAPPETEVQPVRWGVLDAVIGWVVAQTAGVVLTSIILSVGGYSSGEDLPLTLIALGYPPLWLGFVGAPLIATITRGNGPVRDLGARIRAVDVPLGIVAGLVSQYAIVWVVSFPLLKLLGKSMSDLSEPAEKLADKADSRLGVFLFVLIVVIGAPIAEELFFRGLLLRSIEHRLGPWPAITVSAFVFGITHFEALQTPALIAFGLVLGYLVHRTGRLGPSIVAHMAFNGVATISLLAAR